MSVIFCVNGRRVFGVLLSISLASCGGGEAPAPVASNAQFSMVEDSSYSGVVQANTTTGNPLRYVLSVAPANGTATVDTTTGAFTYTPNQDYFGTDAFQFRATDGHLLSDPATVSIQISNVNDPPELRAIANMTNSPETLASTVALQISDVDGDTVNVNASVEDTAIATVEAGGAQPSITVTPVAYGKTAIQVSVRDAEFISQQTFTFEVRDVTKSRTIEAAMTSGEMVTLTNELSRP